MAELTKKTMDGNEAAAYTSYAFTENAAILRSRKVKPLNMVCVESTAVGRIAASIPIAEMTGSATVREHFPTHEMSWIVIILFIPTNHTIKDGIVKHRIYP